MKMASMTAVSAKSAVCYREIMAAWRRRRLAMKLVVQKPRDSMFGGCVMSHHEESYRLKEAQLSWLSANRLMAAAWRLSGATALQRHLAAASARRRK